jgi:hypothetical protein
VRILQCLYFCGKKFEVLKDQELMSKIFACTSEREMRDFWNDMYLIIKNIPPEERIQTLRPLVNCSEANIFSSSLRFSQDSFKISFIEWWSNYFCDCIIQVAGIPELRNSLLGNKTFVDSFWDITSFSLNPPSFLQGLTRLIGMWCLLFNRDVAVYNCFGRKLDSEIQDWLHRRSQSSWGTEKISIFGNYAVEFAGAEHCSGATRNWIQQMKETG